MITALLLSLICRLFCFLATKGHHKLLKDRARKTLKYLHLSQDSESCKKTAKAIFIIDGDKAILHSYIEIVSIYATLREKSTLFAECFFSFCSLFVAYFFNTQLDVFVKKLAKLEKFIKSNYFNFTLAFL